MLPTSHADIFLDKHPHNLLTHDAAHKSTSGHTKFARNCSIGKMVCGFTVVLTATAPATVQAYYRLPSVH